MTGFRGHRVIGGLTFLLIAMLIGVAFPTAHAQEPPPPADVVPLEATEAPTVPPDVSPDDSKAAPTATSTVQPTVDAPPPGTEPTETQAPTVAPTVGAETAETPSSTVAPTVSEATPQPGILTITVLDDVTGEPVSGATVQIDLIDEWRVPWENATTDATGQFVSSEPVPAGEWEAHITHTDYQDQTTNRFLVNGDTEITARLQPGGDGTLTVTVTDAETGEPVAGALLEIFPTNYGGFYPPLAASGTTDEQGRWTSDTALPGGQYMVRTNHLDYRVAFPYVWIAGDTETSLALDPSSHGVFTVTVRDQVTGEPVAGATVTILNRTTDDTTASGTTDETGAFVTEEPIPGHEYRIFVTHDDYFDLWWTTVQVDGPTEEVVTMKPRIAGELTVVVLNADGNPVEGAAVSVRETSYPYATVSDGLTDSDGLFTTEDQLTGGDYGVIVSSDGFNPRSRTVRIDGATELTISLDPHENVTSFTVVDQATGLPIPNAVVGIHRDDMFGRTTIATNITDEGGHVTFLSIYWAGQYGYSVTHDYYDEVEGTLQIAGETETTVELSARPLIEVRVIDHQSEEPLVDAQVTMVQEQDFGTFTQPGEDIADSGSTDADGVFLTAEFVSGATYRIEASHPEYISAEVLIDTDETSRVTVSLLPIVEGALTVTVQDELTGMPISGAKVVLRNADTGEEAAKLQTGKFGEATFGEETPLPGGSYRVEARADGYLNASVTANVSGNSEMVLLMGPDEPGTVKVTVTDGAEPIPDANVTLTGGLWNMRWFHDVTLEDGVVTTYEAFGSGWYTLEVTVDGFDPVSQRFYLVGDTEIEVVIGPSGDASKPAAPESPESDTRIESPLPGDLDTTCFLNSESRECQTQEDVPEDDGAWEKFTLPGR